MGGGGHYARPADDAEELVGYHARFQIIEGKIVRVAQVRGVIYLNFGRDCRLGFSFRYGMRIVPCLATTPAIPRA